jgi:hypothetical protein
MRVKVVIRDEWFSKSFIFDKTNSTSAFEYKDTALRLFIDCEHKMCRVKHILVDGVRTINDVQLDLNKPHLIIVYIVKLNSISV